MAAAGPVGGVCGTFLTSCLCTYGNHADSFAPPHQDHPAAIKGAPGACSWTQLSARTFHAAGVGKVGWTGLEGVVYAANLIMSLFTYSY